MHDPGGGTAEQIGGGECTESPVGDECGSTKPNEVYTDVEPLAGHLGGTCAFGGSRPERADCAILLAFRAWRRLGHAHEHATDAGQHQHARTQCAWLRATCGYLGTTCHIHGLDCGTNTNTNYL